MSRQILHTLWSVGLLPALGHAESLQVALRDIDNLPVKEVAVYLESHDAKSASSMNHPREISQVDRKFSPYVSVVRKGESINFSNQDEITHHVYSFNGPTRFSFKLKKDEHMLSDPFTETGVIAMGCNIHDWMSGYMLVVDTPYYALTDSEGKVAFNDLPSGEYHLKAWHPQMAGGEAISRHVTLQADSVLEIRLSEPMAPVPSQESLNDFDFLDDY